MIAFAASLVFSAASICWCCMTVNARWNAATCVEWWEATVVAKRADFLVVGAAPEGGHAPKGSASGGKPPRRRNKKKVWNRCRALQEGKAMGSATDIAAGKSPSI